MNLEMETFQVFWMKSAIWCEGELFDVRKKDFFGTEALSKDKELINAGTQLLSIIPFNWTSYTFRP